MKGRMKRRGELIVIPGSPLPIVDEDPGKRLTRAGLPYTISNGGNSDHSIDCANGCHYARLLQSHRSAWGIMAVISAKPCMYVSGERAGIDTRTISCPPGHRDRAARRVLIPAGEQDRSSEDRK